jgi:hypothetical protein
MRTLLWGILTCVATAVQAQPIQPQQVVGSAQLSSTLKLISFRVNWVQPQEVDSTMIAVFLSTDTIPVVYKRTKNPDTVSFNIPDDTTTYRFLLVNVRRGLTSQPANVNFFFNADSYYKLTRLHVKPDSVRIDSAAVADTTNVAARTVQFCAFLEYNDGSIVMRDKDRTIPQCLTEYDKFPLTVRKNTGARQRNANTVCLNWQAVGGGTIQNETCSL